MVIGSIFFFILTLATFFCKYLQCYPPIGAFSSIASSQGWIVMKVPRQSSPLTIEPDSRPVLVEKFNGGKSRERKKDIIIYLYYNRVIKYNPLNEIKPACEAWRSICVIPECFKVLRDNSLGFLMSIHWGVG